MNTLKNITILAGVLIIASYAYVNRKRLLKLLMPEEQEEPEINKRKTADAVSEVCNAFLMYADNFQGLFETMYKASEGIISQERTRNVLMEWDIRMNNIVQAPFCMKSWWSTIMADYAHITAQQLQERTRNIIEMILSCGIIRDDRKEFMATEDTNMYYQQSDGIKLEIGQNLHIESPCWYMKTTPVRIIEKGYCEII